MRDAADAAAWQQDDAPEEGTGWRRLAVDGAVLALLLAFVGLDVYALAAANSDAVRQGCPMLWEFMLVRLCAAMVLTAGMFASVCRPARTGWSTEWTIVLWGVMLAYFSGFTVAAGIVVSQAMLDNAGCPPLLSAASATGTPLLGIIGWVWLVVDGLYTLMLLILGAISACHELYPDEDAEPPP